MSADVLTYAVFAPAIVCEARKHHQNGIWVRCDYHPSGYDFLSFAKISPADDFVEAVTHRFGREDLSGGIYREHPFMGKTLPEILEKVGFLGYCYTLGEHPWCT